MKCRFEVTMETPTDQLNLPHNLIYQHKLPTLGLSVGLSLSHLLLLFRATITWIHSIKRCIL